MTTLEVHPSNATQRAAWDGEEGSFWAQHADHFDRSVALHHARFMEAAAIRPGEHVLDVGCGTGETSCDAARAAGDGPLLGVDLSSAMLAVARRRASLAGLGRVEFLQADAQIQPFEAQSFDAVLGRCAVMFFGDQPAALRNLGRALRPGGRLTFLTWQAPERVTWFGEFTTALAAGRPRPAPPPDAPNPFSWAEPRRIRELLDDAGFVDSALTASDAAMRFGDDVDDAFNLVSGLLGWMVSDLEEGRRRRALDDLRASLQRHDSGDGVWYDSAAWIVTARRPLG